MSPQFPSFNSARFAQIRETEKRNGMDRLRFQALMPVPPQSPVSLDRSGLRTFGIIPCHSGGFLPAVLAENGQVKTPVRGGSPVILPARKAFRTALLLSRYRHANY